MGFIYLILVFAILFGLLDGSLIDRIMAICVITIIFMGAMAYFNHVSESAKAKEASEKTQVGTASLPEDNPPSSEATPETTLEK
jgi:F0F1-type ATP synthase assembly protein I